MFFPFSSVSNQTYLLRKNRYQLTVFDRLNSYKKIIIITGAGSGIGKKTAILFAKEGAKVIVADVNEKGGNETVAEIKKNGEGFFAKLDVTNREQSKQMVKTTLGKYGRIDVLINNAGIVQDAPQFGFCRTDQNT